jgi:cytochrome b pre-mRNA-processing protein 3
MLHMYLLSARFRALTTDSKPWQQHLLDHFSYDAENRMTTHHNMHARGTRNKYLKDLFIQWRGLLAAYDEGLAKGDAVLAAAVWRNVFKADENVDIKGLAMVVSYMRRTLKRLDALPDDQVVLGEIGFGSPQTEEGVVKVRSAMLDLPFEKAPGKDLPGKKSDDGVGRV